MMGRISEPILVEIEVSTQETTYIYGRDEDFLEDEENEIVEPDVDVHLFGISMDLPFDNIGITNLVSDDVLEGEDVDVINADGFDSDPINDEEKNYRKRRLAELRIEMEGVINASGQWKYSFNTDQKFTTPKEVKDRVYLHSIESRRNLKLYKNDGVRIRARCDQKVLVYTMSQGTGPTSPNCRMEAGPSGLSGPTIRSKKRKNTGTNDDSKASSSILDAHDKWDLYPWVLYVGKYKFTKNWVVKTYTDTHTCLQSREIKHCTYKFLFEKIFEQVRVNPDIPVKAVQDQHQRELEVQISMSKAFRAKAKAERDIRGDHVLQYSMLSDYVVELQSTNPNTTVKIAVKSNTDPSLPTRVFQRIYVCLGALKLGFRACGRDMLGLDGAFIKGPFPGQVLVAIGLDSNNGIYPLAYALVEAEMIDKRVSFQPLKLCTQRATSATNVRDFEKCMLELKTMNPKAHEWLNKIPAEHWARSYFSGRAKFEFVFLQHLDTTPRNLGKSLLLVEYMEGNILSQDTTNLWDQVLGEVHMSNKTFVTQASCLGKEQPLHVNLQKPGTQSRQACKIKGDTGQRHQQVWAKMSGASGVHLGLSAAAGEGGAGGVGGIGGIGVAIQGSSHSIWTKRRVQTEKISPQKRTPTQPTSQPSTSSQVLVSEIRNADGREMGDGVPTQSSATGGASE
ncbi:hypothetical protein Tco_0489958 [Tanacetum coccineum]